MHAFEGNLHSKELKKWFLVRVRPPDTNSRSRVVYVKSPQGLNPQSLVSCSPTVVTFASHVHVTSSTCCFVKFYDISGQELTVKSHVTRVTGSSAVGVPIRES